ncbi:hypothetical protein CaCOL14_009375 [Colletotrichum acutatum]
MPPQSVISTSSSQGNRKSSPMLERYLEDAPTITEKLSKKSMNSTKSIKATKIKQTKNHIKSWEDSWRKMAESR